MLWSVEFSGRYPWFVADKQDLVAVPMFVINMQKNKA